MLEQVKQYSSSKVINKLQQALAGGESLQNILQRSVKQGGMPVMYWKWIQDTACAELGKQCKTAIDHRVIDFYIPADKNQVQEEIWMTADNLEDWLSLLKPFKYLGTLPVSRQRQIFSQLLRIQVQKIIGKYPRYDIALSEELSEAKKKVLPMRHNSPLLQYSIKEIHEEIEACARLINWVADIRKVLQKISNDSTQRPVFTSKYPIDDSLCPLSEKGKKIPELKFE